MRKSIDLRGGSRGGARGPGAPSYFWTKLRPEGSPSPYLRVWMTPCPPSPLSEGLDPPVVLTPESQIRTKYS